MRYLAWSQHPPPNTRPIVWLCHAGAGAVQGAPGPVQGSVEVQPLAVPRHHQDPAATVWVCQSAHMLLHANAPLTHSSYEMSYVIALQPGAHLAPEARCGCVDHEVLECSVWSSGQARCLAANKLGEGSQLGCVVGHRAKRQLQG
jgi:hypothetical protein